VIKRYVLDERRRERKLTKTKRYKQKKKEAKDPVESDKGDVETREEQRNCTGKGGKKEKKRRTQILVQVSKQVTKLRDG